jgi:protein-S-isoprenylcysteine O-methyltransferase Ste14
MLRLVLFLGLVAHKLVWEILKRRKGVSAKAGQSSTSFLKTLVKQGKVAFLVFILLQTLFLDLFPILQEPFYLRAIGTGLFFVGLATAVMGRLQLGDNWANLEDYNTVQESKLVDAGIYRFIRHPIYTGDILMLIGLELALNSWLVLLVVAPILVVVKQTTAEEKLLAQVFPHYFEYRLRTKRFIPFLI